MANIYDQHKAAFPSVSAYVILSPDHKERIATIAFKFPRDGAGRLYCYLHWTGLGMVRGFAPGYGYDKMTAAAADAIRKMLPELPTTQYADGVPHHTEANRAQYAALREVLLADNGHRWNDALSKAGFHVYSAV